MAGTELIICPSCGKDIGSLNPAFVYLTKIKKEKIIEKRYKDLDPHNYDITIDVTDYKDILDFLNISHICCRSHMLSTARLSDLYHSFPIPR